MKKEQKKIPLAKKPKPSGFDKKPFLRREEFRTWLKRGELWRFSKMSERERVGLERKLFNLKGFGEVIDRREAEKVYREIKNFPINSKRKYGLKSAGERLQTLKILEKLLGK